ncbi:Protein of unknown function [Streptomyces sp. yr375]|uniref:DUF742 domain-containing protein n=1 Tax=Streptomyces sp. yr375 TaxID=1761906 RepID=UPI0008AEFB57|nr:DUF742 domain-containing protein [Streptomyces sp. yr375]SEQ69510.1 Protein of unknown function [Streptomyces sp. yr375]
MTEDGRFEHVGRLVRPFTITGGRTEPSRNIFTLITIVTATAAATASGGAGGTASGLQLEHQRALELCTVPAAVAEISAHLDLPVTVTKILLSDLLDQGIITATPPAQGLSGPDIALLQRVREGLAKL